MLSIAVRRARLISGPSPCGPASLLAAARRFARRPVSVSRCGRTVTRPGRSSKAFHELAADFDDRSTCRDLPTAAVLRHRRGLCAESFKTSGLRANVSSRRSRETKRGATHPGRVWTEIDCQQFDRLPWRRLFVHDVYGPAQSRAGARVGEERGDRPAQSRGVREGQGRRDRAAQGHALRDRRAEESSIEQPATDASSLASPRLEGRVASTSSPSPVYAALIVQQPQGQISVVEQKAMTPQGFTRPCTVEDPTILHGAHALIFVFTLGLWTPCWIMACCDKDCQRPLGTCVLCGTRI